MTKELRAELSKMNELDLRELRKHIAITKAFDSYMQHLTVDEIAEHLALTPTEVFIFIKGGIPMDLKMIARIETMEIFINNLKVKDEQERHNTD